MLTKKSKYALKALMILAGHAGQGPMLVTDLAARERIPKKFLEAILLDLKRHGLLQSKKGKGGGYFLLRPPAEITVGQVVRLLDGPLALVPCASQTAYMPCDDCEDEDACAIRWAMKEVRDATAKILDNTTLATLNSQAGSPKGGRKPARRPARK